MATTTTAPSASPGADPSGSLLHARLVQARLEALTELGLSDVDARRLARAVDADIRAVAALVRRGCDPRLVLRILR